MCLIELVDILRRDRWSMSTFSGIRYFQVPPQFFHLVHAKLYSFAKTEKD